MIVKRRVKLGDYIYLVEYKCKYIQRYGYLDLSLSEYKNPSYDSGCSRILLEKVEKNYNLDAVKSKYNTKVSFLDDSLYLYDNIPYLSGVYICSTNKNNELFVLSYVTKEELDEVINTKNIIMKNNDNFDLNIESTWNVD